MTSILRFTRLVGLVTACLVLFLLTPPALAVSETFAARVDATGVAKRWHSVGVDRPGEIAAVLAWDTVAANLDLALRDPSGTIVARATSFSARPESLRYDAPAPGLYQLAVTAKKGASNYTLDVTHSNATVDVDDWPMLQHDPIHSGLSTGTSIKASNAASLGIQWQANTGYASYVSPAVVYNETLDRSLVYAANHQGTIAAYDATTGERVWWLKVGAGILSSPAVSEGVVYIGSNDHNLYALDAATGAVLCTFDTGGVISTSPTVVDVPSEGRLVFLGDNGLTGADDGGSVLAIHAVDPDAAANCSLEWRFTSWGDPPGSQIKTGSWSSPGYALDATGRPLLVFGSSSPDNAVYALDARTGERVWRFQTEVFGRDDDVGAGPAISLPGTNGFADGVAYISGKNRITYALNLTTGQKIWEFRVRDDSPTAGGSTRSTAALVGDRLYVGYGAGVYSFDAITGAKVWKSEEVGASIDQVLSSPAVTGVSGDRVLFIGDLAGRVYAIDAQNGDVLWSYETGGMVFSSAAVSDDKFFIASSDGFLYAFGLGGDAPSAKPHTELTSPTDGEAVTNTPATPLRLSGTATDDSSVDRVIVAIKDKNLNKWWDGSTGTWKPVFIENEATLSAGGTGATNWHFDAFPMPLHGGLYFGQAEAVDADGQHDSIVALSNFSIPSAGNPPETTIDTPQERDIYHLDKERNVFSITISGTASDAAGAKPGIKAVKVVVQNKGHKEYYCGFSGCGGAEESNDWTPTYKVLDATLASPGTQDTAWSLSFPVYDHPHVYKIVAWAVDKDGEPDKTRATVTTVCVRDWFDNSCVG